MDLSGNQIKKKKNSFKTLNGCIPFHLSFLKMQVGLKGEEFGLYNGVSSLWTSESSLPTNQPLTWYKVMLRLFVWSYSQLLNCHVLFCLVLFSYSMWSAILTVTTDFISSNNAYNI